MIRLSLAMAGAGITAGAIALGTGHVVMAGLCVVASVFASAIGTIRQGAAVRTTAPEETMDQETRSLYVPVKRYATQIQEFVRDHQASVLVKVVGEEASRESKVVSSQIALLLARRAELRKLTKGKATVVRSLEDIDQRLESAQDSERNSLSKAREATVSQIEHIERAEAAITTIDATVREASAALGEMKARLETGIATEQLDTAGSDELRASIGRLHGLASGYEEAKEFLEQGG